jgi:hypothetical protein
MGGELAMDALSTGSLQSWIGVAATALSPLMALLMGFVGTDRLLRWQLGEKRDQAPLEGTRASKVHR